MNIYILIVDKNQDPNEIVQYQIMKYRMVTSNNLKSVFRQLYLELELSQTTDM